MTAWPWVALGGALGSLARYAVGSAFAGTATRFPWPTLTINVAGCLAIGLVAGTWARTPALPHTAATFLTVGVLGGFTTFSAFGLETIVLLRRGETTLAFAYVLASVVVGVVAAWIGLRATGG